MDTSIYEFVDKVKLRNWHCVSQGAECFIVEQIRSDGAKRPEVTSIPVDAIDRLYELCHGKEILPQTAVNYILSFAHKYNLPYTYGYKLRFYAQEMLVVLVATRRAIMIPNGKGFKYQVT